MIVLTTESEQAIAAELMTELARKLGGRTFVLVVDAREDGDECGDIHSNAPNRDELLGLLYAATKALGGDPEGLRTA